MQYVSVINRKVLNTSWCISCNQDFDNDELLAEHKENGCDGITRHRWKKGANSSDDENGPKAKIGKTKF